MGDVFLTKPPSSHTLVRERPHNFTLACACRHGQIERPLAWQSKIERVIGTAPPSDPHSSSCSLGHSWLAFRWFDKLPRIAESTIHEAAPYFAEHDELNPCYPVGCDSILFFFIVPLALSILDQRATAPGIQPSKFPRPDGQPQLPREATTSSAYQKTGRPRYPFRPPAYRRALHSPPAYKRAPRTTHARHLVNFYVQKLSGKTRYPVSPAPVRTLSLRTWM